MLKPDFKENDYFGLQDGKGIVEIKKTDLQQAIKDKVNEVACVYLQYVKEGDNDVFIITDRKPNAVYFANLKPIAITQDGDVVRDNLKK